MEYIIYYVDLVNNKIQSDDLRFLEVSASPTPSDGVLINSTDDGSPAILIPESRSDGCVEPVEGRPFRDEKSGAMNSSSLCMIFGTSLHR